MIERPPPGSAPRPPHPSAASAGWAPAPRPARWRRPPARCSTDGPPKNCRAPALRRTTAAQPAVGISRPWTKRGTITSPVIMPAPNTAKTSGTRVSAHMGDGKKRAGEIGIDREHAAKADGADAQGQPHLPFPSAPSSRNGLAPASAAGAARTAPPASRSAATAAPRCRSTSASRSPGQPLRRRHADDGPPPSIPSAPAPWRWRACHAPPARRPPAWRRRNRRRAATR